MSKRKTLFGLVLDHSGSMASLTPSTVEGVNRVISDLKALDPREAKVYFTECQFGSQLQTPYVGVDIRDVPAMTASWGPHPYAIEGCTKLFDAVGTTIKGMERWIENNKFKGQVKVAILTDGAENESREWHIHHPRRDGDDRDLLGLIEYKQKQGWEFLFQGTGGSSWLERTFGSVVSHDHFVGYAHNDHAHTSNYMSLSNTISSSALRGTSFNNAGFEQSQTAAPPAPQTSLINTLLDGHQTWASTTSADASKTVAPLKVVSKPSKEPAKQ